MQTVFVCVWRRTYIFTRIPHLLAERIAAGISLFSRVHNLKNDDHMLTIKKIYKYFKIFILKGIKEKKKKKQLKKKITLVFPLLLQ